MNRVSPLLLKALSYQEAIEFSALGLPLLPMAALMPAAYSRTTVEVVHGLDDILHTHVRTSITETGGESEVLVARTTAGTSSGAAAKAADKASAAAGDGATGAGGAEAGAGAGAGAGVGVPQASEPRIMGVAVRLGIIAITMSTFDMWGAPGFLTRVFCT